MIFVLRVWQVEDVCWLHALAELHCGADTLELDTNIVGVWHIGGMLSQSLFSVN